jgi:SAM-dependent methyltransferase
MKLFRERYLEQHIAQPLRILDVGSQDVNGTYKPFFEVPRWTYVGADMAPGKNVDVVLDTPYRWRQFPGESFDVVVSGQAFEHVEFFWITILEIGRILKPHGICCIIAPAGGFEHRYPVDCWRFYRDGFRALAKWARLEVLEATTQWQNDHHEDGSDLWQDSVLIARKPSHGGLSALKQRLKYRVAVELLSRMVHFRAPEPG